MPKFTDKFKPKAGNGFSFASKIIRENSIIYHLNLALDDGRNYFYIIEIEKAKHHKFQQDTKIPQVIDLNTYGEILHKGYGQPSDALKADLDKKYGLYSNSSNPENS